MTAVNDKISTIVNGKRVITKKPELLAPAGNLEKLKIAVHYGADAVFIGDRNTGFARMPITLRSKKLQKALNSQRNMARRST